MPYGARVLVFAYALGWPLMLIGQKTRLIDLVQWLAFSPSLLWHGEVWTAFTYAFLSLGPLDWAVNLFWFATLVSVMCRDWSGTRLWIFCLLTAAAGALFVALLLPHLQGGLVGNAAMIFGLLGAWWKIYGNERLVLLGLGEVSVKQAALLIGAIELLVLFFSVGWQITLAMLGGGAAGWLWLLVGRKRQLAKPAEPVESERIARLEL